METKLLFSQTKQMLKWRLIQVGHRNQKSLFLGLPNINCYESFWDIKWSWRCFSYLLSKNSSQFDSHCMFLGVLLMEKLSPENVNAWVSLDHFVGIYRRSDYCAGLYCKTGVCGWEPFTCVCLGCWLKKASHGFVFQLLVSFMLATISGISQWGTSWWSTEKGRLEGGCNGTSFSLQGTTCNK